MEIFVLVDGEYYASIPVGQLYSMEVSDISGKYLRLNPLNIKLFSCYTEFYRSFYSLTNNCYRNSCVDFSRYFINRRFISDLWNIFTIDLYDSVVSLYLCMLRRRIIVNFKHENCRIFFIVWRIYSNTDKFIVCRINNRCKLLRCKIIRPFISKHGNHSVECSVDYIFFFIIICYNCIFYIITIYTLN